jgi:phosphoserine phosphatase
MNNKFKYKVVAFDLDGTLVRKRNSWITLHEYFGTTEGAKKNFEAFENSKIDYSEFIRRDIALWPKETNIDEIISVFSIYNLMPNSKYVTIELKKNGYVLVIISAGIDILAKKVAQDLGFHHFLANGLEIDKNGFLTGKGIIRVDPLKKHESLDAYLKNINLTLDDCISIGDSRIDKNLLKHSGFSIAFGNDESLKEYADVVINDLIDLLKYA